MVSQVQKVGTLPIKVSNYHTQHEHNILSVLLQKVTEVRLVLQVRVKYITSRPLLHVPITKYKIIPNPNPNPNTKTSVNTIPTQM